MVRFSLKATVVGDEQDRGSGRCCLVLLFSVPIPSLLLRLFGRRRISESSEYILVLPMAAKLHQSFQGGIRCMVLGDASRRLAGVSPTVHEHESDMIVCPHRKHMRPC